MRKFLIIFLCLSLMIAFVGCGSEQTAAPDNTNNEPTITNENVSLLVSEGDEHKNAKVELTGHVFLTPEKDSNGIYFQMYSDVKNDDINTLVGYEDPNFELNDGDYVVVKGIFKETQTAENAFGGQLTLPVVIADSVEIKSYMDVVAPAIHTIDVNETQDHSGYVLTVDKIEFTESESRVYVTIKNNTSEKIHFYTFNSKGIQGNKQLEEQENYDADYEEPQSEILPGIETSGIIAFEPFDYEAKQLKLIFEGSCQYYDLEINPFNFDLSWE